MSARLKTESVIALALTLLAAVLLNRVAERWPVRVDLTRDGRHTLAEPTRRLLGQLEGPLDLRAYLPTHVRPPYSEVVRGMLDLLEAYRAAGDGRVRLKVVDPTDDSLGPAERAQLIEEAKGYGIKPAELTVTRDDRQVRERVLFGVAVLYRDRQAAVPPVQRPDQLEYALTRALRDVLSARARRPVIAFSTGHGEPPVLDSPVAEVLKASGELKGVALGDELVPPTVDALVIVGPRRALEPRARYAVDQFLLRGGAVVALLDHHPPSTVFPHILVDAPTGLEPLLNAYGLALQPKAVVLDREDNAAPAVGRDADGRAVKAQHPAYPRSRDLAERHPITGGLASLVVPYGIPVDPSAARAQGLTVTALVRSGPASVVGPKAASPDPAQYADPADGERPGPVALAVAARGSFPSAFAGRPAPPAPELAPGKPQRPRNPPRLERAQGEGRLVVITSGTRLLASDPNGLLFLQNAIDWAVTSTELVALRARAADDPPLAITDERTRFWMKAGNIAGPPLLLMAFGLLRARRRRRRA